MSIQMMYALQKSTVVITVITCINMSAQKHKSFLLETPLRLGLLSTEPEVPGAKSGGRR